MKVELYRNRIQLVPETDQDVAFIEDTLGLTKGGNFVRLVRHDTRATEMAKEIDPCKGFDLRAMAHPE